MDNQKRPLGLWGLYRTGGLTPAITSMFDTQSAQRMAFIRSVMKEQRKTSLFHVPLQELEVIVFDLETTGFHAYQGDEIISFGGVFVKGQDISRDESFYSLVNPGRNIPAHIERLTGITNEDVLSAPELIAVLRDFLEYANKYILIAHGSQHDKQFLNAALWKTSRIHLTHRVIDTMMIAKWLHPELTDYGLDELLNLYDIPITQRHHALEDSLMTAQLWSRMIDRILAKQVKTLGDLYAYLSRY
jgi:DNA polymerase-3 subunit epsilon